MQFEVDAMRCGGCARSIVSAIRSIDPQANIDVDLTMKRAVVGSGVNERAIAAGRGRAGYPPRRSA
jgi:copper chaperone